MIKNNELKEFYDAVYKKGEGSHYTKLFLNKNVMSQEKEAIINELSWKNKRVLDIGCGTGELAYRIAERGAKYVEGIDYSPEAIKIAEGIYKYPTLSYKVKDVKDIDGMFDVITLVGVLEHIDDPLGLLQIVKTFLNRGGSLIVTCPNWSNARGYILMALKELFGLRITLVDIHYFTPIDFEQFRDDLKLSLSWKTIEQEWGHGYKMIEDLKKRLPNVLKDTPQISATDITKFISWLEKTVPILEGDNKHTGAVGFYHFKNNK